MAATQEDTRRSEGPPEAEKLLASQGWPETVIQRVSYLVGHHHTYTDIDGTDYQLLVEADFLVNLFEEGALRNTGGRVPEDLPDGKRKISVPADLSQKTE